MRHQRLPRAAQLAGFVALCLCAAGWASIHDAARDGDVAKLEKFVASGSSVDAADSDGWTPLMHAAAAGRAEAVAFLLEHGADANKAGPTGTTPLHVAVNAAAKESLYGSAGKKSRGGPRDYDAVILDLLDHGADATIKARNGYTALSWFETKYADKGASLTSPVLARLRKASGAEAPAAAPAPVAAAATAASGRLGLAVAASPEGGIVISAVADDVPAAKAGLRPGDRILEIARRSTVGMTAAQATALLRGDPGTTVILTVQHDGRRLMLQMRRLPGAEIVAPASSVSATAAESKPAAATPSAPLPVASDVDSPRERGAQRPDDFALVIGVEDYQSLPKADYGVRDAEAVRRHLVALGVPERNIIALEGSQATKSRLESYLQDWLPLNVKPDSTLFVYYSGHGAPDPTSGKAYLVPWDGDPMFLKRTGYPIERLYADLAKTKAKRVVVALDACFSGAGGRSVLAKGARPLVTKIDEDVPAASNLTVLAAASGDQITGTLDDQGHGIFTYYFLKGLSGAAKDASGAVTANSLYAYLKPRVEDEARRQNRAQTPTLAGTGATLSAP